MVFGINGINTVVKSGSSNNSEQVKERNFFKRECKGDSFERKEDKSNNGKFDLSEAAKNFVKGVISPVTAALKHPIITAGVVAATMAACTLVPVLGPIMTVGFLGASVVQLGKGCYNVAKNIKNKDYDAAEKSFESVGQGTVGTALGVLGLKQSAQVAKEAKMMQELNTTTLTEAQREAAAMELKGNSVIKNLKEITSLVTTKQGRQALVSQFKPSMIKQRAIDTVNKFKGTKVEKEVIKETKRQKAKEDFKKTPEGVRRAAMSDEQIEAEVQGLFDQAFDELGIPKEQRPKLEIDFKDKSGRTGGSYSHSKHTIEYNPQSYREGIFEMDDVIMHEATHCKEALTRAGIPQDRVDSIVEKELISRIQNGESEKIIVKGNFFGPDMMEPPKMSSGMKSEFAEFARENLYTKSKDFSSALREYSDQAGMIKSGSKYADPAKFDEAQKTLSPIIDKLQKIMKNHPEFQQQYATEEEALNALMEYSLSHNTRFNSFTDVSVGGWLRYDSKVSVPELTGDALTHAEQSLIDNITTIEGNGRISGLNGFFASESSFNQYQFSPEEVLAQKNGNEFLIKNLSAKMKEMKLQGTLSKEDEAYLMSVIEKAKATIEYKTKGLEYYQQYTKMINNPEDTALQAAVKAMEQELLRLKENINPKQFEIIKETIKVYENPNRVSTNISANAIYDLISRLKESEKQ